MMTGDSELQKVLHQMYRLQRSAWEKRNKHKTREAAVAELGAVLNLLRGLIDEAWLLSQDDADE